MRLSADRDDAGFDIAVYMANVLFNGVELKDCVTADEEAGTVKIVARDASGNIIVDGDKAGTSMMAGNVQIIAAPGYEKEFEVMKQNVANWAAPLCSGNASYPAAERPRNHPLKDKTDV
jgi:hypothetical protein